MTDAPVHEVLAEVVEIREERVSIQVFSPYRALLRTLPNRVRVAWDVMGQQCLFVRFTQQTLQAGEIVAAELRTTREWEVVTVRIAVHNPLLCATVVSTARSNMQVVIKPEVLLETGLPMSAGHVSVSPNVMARRLLALWQDPDGRERLVNTPIRFFTAGLNDVTTIVAWDVVLPADE